MKWIVVSKKLQTERQAALIPRHSAVNAKHRKEYGFREDDSSVELVNCLFCCLSPDVLPIGPDHLNSGRTKTGGIKEGQTWNTHLS